MTGSVSTVDFAGWLTVLRALGCADRLAGALDQALTHYAPEAIIRYDEFHRGPISTALWLGDTDRLAALSHMVGDGRKLVQAALEAIRAGGSSITLQRIGPLRLRPWLGISFGST